MIYELSEKLFLDLWEEFGRPAELEKFEDVLSFLRALIQRSQGNVVVDHFSGENYDRIDRVECLGNYVKIVWKDFSDFCKRKEAGILTYDEWLTWNIFGEFAEIYTLLDVEKILFRKERDHLFLIFRTNLIDLKKIESLHKHNGWSTLKKEQCTDSFYTQFIVSKEIDGKHIYGDCIVYTLPFCVMLIHAKENCNSSYYSRIRLVHETMEEIYRRFELVLGRLDRCDERDVDEIEEKGNTIRKLMEYSLKFYCAYMGISMKMERQYKHITLGDLRDKLKDTIPDINSLIPQSLIIEANKYAHDIGRKSSKEDLILFSRKVEDMLVELTKRIINDIILLFN